MGFYVLNVGMFRWDSLDQTTKRDRYARDLRNPINVPKNHLEPSLLPEMTMGRKSGLL